MEKDKNINEREIDIEKRKKQITALKNLKMSLAVTRFFAPYVLGLTILTGGCKLLLGWPFAIDSYKKYSNTKNEFDSLGNISTTQQYDSFMNSDSVIKYFSKWEKENDNTYTRNVKTYKLREYSEDAILAILEKKDVKLEDIFGNPVEDSKEIRSNLSKEELQRGDYMQAIMYDVDKNDFIYVEETKSENTVRSIAYCIFAFFITIKWLSSKGIEKLEKRTDIINEEYEAKIKKLINNN